MEVLRYILRISIFVFVLLRFFINMTNTETSNIDLPDCGRHINYHNFRKIYAPTYNE